MRVAPVTETLVAEIPGATDVGPRPSENSYDASTEVAASPQETRANEINASKLRFIVTSWIRQEVIGA